MPPILRGTPTSGAVSGASPATTVARPTGVVAGDLLLIWMTSSGAATAAGLSVSGGTGGWNTLGSGVTLSTFGAGKWLYRIADGSEPASFTVSANGTDVVAGCVAIQGGSYDSGAPFPVGSSAYGSGTDFNVVTQTAPSVTGRNDGWLLAGHAALYTGSASANFTPGSGMTELVDRNPGATGRSALAVNNRALTADGATGTATADVSIGSRWVSGSIALSGPAAPQAYTPAVADTAGATDNASAGLTLPRAAGPDAAAATDAMLALLSKGAGPDPAAATDAVGRVADMVRAHADTVRLADAVTADYTRPDISDYQFVIPVDPWMPFGLGQTIVVENFSPGAAETRDQDVLSPVADVRYFGSDRRTPPVWSFDLYTDVENAEQALAWASLFEAVWDHEEVRSQPGAVLPLRYRVGGRTRRVYGRPRNFAMVPNYVRTGRVSMVADFVLADNTFYDDAEGRATVRVRGTSSRSGFIFPLQFPATTMVNPEPRSEQVTIGGTRPTWIDLVFWGPIMDPWVQIGSQRWGLRGSLASGQSVTVSGVPWRQGLLRSDGAWVPGMLDPRARLSQLRLPPGTFTATLGGSPASTQARVEVVWRNAYGTM